MRVALDTQKILSAISNENACMGKEESTSKKISNVCDRRDKMGIRILGLMEATCARVLPKGNTPTPHWDMDTLPRNSPPTTAILALPSVRKISATLTGFLISK